MARATWPARAPGDQETPRASASQWGAPRPVKAGTKTTSPAVGHRSARASTSAGTSDQAEAVAQPLDGRTADENAALEGVGRAPGAAGGDGGGRPCCDKGARSPVCMRRSSRCRRCFGQARGETGLAGEGALLVADAGGGERRPVREGRIRRRRWPRIDDGGQDGGRNGEQIEEFGPRPRCGG